jgi:stress-induced morphogen
MSVRMLDPQQLTAIIVAALPDADIEVEDLTGGSDHYKLRIVSQRFEGMKPLQRHRLVYAALRAELKHDIHALSLDTIAPSER